MPVCIVHTSLAVVFNQSVSILNLCVTVLIVTTCLSIVEGKWKVNWALLRGSPLEKESVYDVISILNMVICMKQTVCKVYTIPVIVTVLNFVPLAYSQYTEFSITT